MPVKKKINNNLTKSSSPANFKILKIVIMLFGVVVACVLILMFLNTKCTKKEAVKETIDDQIYKLSKKAETSNFDFGENKSLDSTSNVDEETNLPIVDQEKLGEEYMKDLKEILAALEDQIKLSSDGETIDVEAIKIIKKKAMEEVVPIEYQSLHIDLIFALDSIINGDVNRAMNDLEEIKSNITE